MELALDGGLAAGYRSRSQWARVVTEAWAQQSLYCLACPSASLTPHAANTKVEDFCCALCNRRLQLKAKLGPVGRTVSNSAYATKLAAIRQNRAPDYGFLSYNLSPAVTDLVVVPGHFLTESTISARKPLGPTARRAGWVGSNIHLDRIPDAGKVHVIQGGKARIPRDVRSDFHRTAFLATLPAESRGWLADVMTCIDRLVPGKGPFELRDLYGFTGALGRLHPENHHVKDKIRQQVQILGRKGYLRFVGRGEYEKL